MPKSSIVLLKDMLNYAEHARDFLDGVTFDAFTFSLEKQFAVLRAVEIVGEAASQYARIHDAGTADLPILAMIGMRNHIAHGYAELDLKIIYDTVRIDIPELIATLKTMLEPD
jgi:uncharacterized protein with HEPN domain